MKTCFALALTVAGCAAPAVTRAPDRPAWRGEASVDQECSVWLRRSAAARDASWRLRAARRAFLCFSAGGEEPFGALEVAIKLDPSSPFTLAMAEHFLAHATPAQRPGRMRLAEPWLDAKGRLGAAFLLGAAATASAPERGELLRRCALLDATGERGRRAMLALAKSAAKPAQEVAWLRKALQPHRSVLASFGHAEFAGLSAAAVRLRGLCIELGDRACAAFAAARATELER